MDSTLIQENIRLKDELDAAKKYIVELELYKAKFFKHIDYEINLMSSEMRDGPAKDEFRQMMLKMMLK
jgi:hypothetical protein